MVYAIVILAVIAFISIVLCFTSWQRIRSVSRQLKYINQHDTNMIVTGGYSNAGINELAGEINELLAGTAKMRKEYSNKESNLRETLTNLSHDIRTPLTSLDGYFQLLYESNSAAERERYIGIIRERIEILKQLLDELFTYTKLQDKSYPLEMAHHNLNSLLYDTVFSFYDDLKRQNIEPEIRIAEEPIIIYGNDAALKRAMQNIIKNSLEHGEKSFCLQLEKTGDTAVITFQNRYRNTDEIDIEHIFDRFYKADTARKQTSTGLGLAIAKELVERMNGEISAHIDADLFVVRIQFPAVLFL